MRAAIAVSILWAIAWAVLLGYIMLAVDWPSLSGLLEFSWLRWIWLGVLAIAVVLVYQSGSLRVLVCLVVLALGLRAGEILQLRSRGLLPSVSNASQFSAPNLWYLSAAGIAVDEYLRDPRVKLEQADRAILEELRTNAVDWTEDQIANTTEVEMQRDLLRQFADDLRSYRRETLADKSAEEVESLAEQNEALNARANAVREAEQELEAQIDMAKPEKLSELARTLADLQTEGMKLRRKQVAVESRIAFRQNWAGSDSKLAIIGRLPQVVAGGIVWAWTYAIACGIHILATMIGVGAYSRGARNGAVKLHWAMILLLGAVLAW